MILMRETTPGTSLRGTRVASVQDAVDAEADDELAADRLEVDVRGALVDALGDERVDELDDRRVVAGLAQVDDLGAVVLDDVLLDGDVLELCSRRAMSAAMSSSTATAGRDVVAGHQRDVVDGQHVAGIDHGHEQRASVGEADGHGAVALGGRRRQQVGRGHVDAEDVEVDVVDAEALGDDARELVGREHAAVDQDLARAAVGGLRLLDRRLDRLVVRVAEADDDVADLLGVAAAVGGLGDARRGGRRRGLGDGGHARLIGSGGPIP